MFGVGRLHILALHFYSIIPCLVSFQIPSSLSSRLASTFRYTSSSSTPYTNFQFIPATSVLPLTVVFTASGDAINLNKNLNAFELLTDDLRNALSNELGILQPNEVQNSSLPVALSGDDVFVIAQTGSGKTLSFLLPILHRLAGTSNYNTDGDGDISPKMLKRGSVVIGPTEELLAQHRAIATKLAPSLVHRILFKTSHQLLSDLKNESHCIDVDIVMVAIDEVDAVLCGSEFDDTCPDSSTELLRLLPDRTHSQYILTTAHLTRAHTKVVNQLFPKMRTIQQSTANGMTNQVLVPSLKQEFHYFSGNNIAARLSKLLDILVKAQANDDGKNNNIRSSTLVFCKDEDEVEVVHSFLTDNPSTNETYFPRKLHSRLPPQERSDALAALLKNDDGNCRLLVTHEIAARGLDCPSVGHVILFDTPTDVTAFVHRSGRTARAGEEGLVTCLVSAGGFGSGGFGRHKVLHELNDAPRLSFVKERD